MVTLLPLPKNVFAALAGVLFGLLLGIVVVLLAALLGAAAFALTRVLGRDAIERIAGSRVARVDALLARRGRPAVIAVRLVPLLPFTAINYAAGLTSVRTRDYAIGTAWASFGHGLLRGTGHLRHHARIGAVPVLGRRADHSHRRRPPRRPEISPRPQRRRPRRLASIAAETQPQPGRGPLEHQG